MTKESKSRQRAVAFWTGIITMVGTVVGAFVLAFSGQGDQVNAIASLVGTTNIALAGLGTANYLSSPKD